MLVDDSYRIPGLRSVCVREIQKTLKQSAKKLIEDKIVQHRLGEHFLIRDNQIKTPGDGVIIFQGMQDHTAESIKSLEGFHRAWWEEAQTATKKSLDLLRPTIRAEKSELWFSWNPRRRLDPVDNMFRAGNAPTDSIAVQANWRDNPWFPSVLEQERLDCLRDDPDQYDHIWEGDYVTMVKGAYYTEHLARARAEKRVGRFPRDPIIPVHLYCDIGGTGRRSDAFVIWAVQFIRKEIRMLNYYEVVGQTYEDHLYWMRDSKYLPGNSKIILPHDGTTSDRVMPVTYESVFQAAGYNVETIKNQGEGAAMARIAAARRLFKFITFNDLPCKDGFAALGWYHEKWDDVRDIGMGPEHDWASHAADAFGLMAISYTEPGRQGKNETIPPELPDY